MYPRHLPLARLINERPVVAAILKGIVRPDIPLSPLSPLVTSSPPAALLLPPKLQDLVTQTFDRKGTRV
jgi:hypothetical protein